MPYTFMLDGWALPVAPGALTLKIQNQNETVTLIDGGEATILKTPGLTGVSFEALLPAMDYPFVSGAESPDVYLDRLEKLKTEKKSFQFVVTRTRPDGSLLYDTNLTVSLEDYEIDEDAESLGLDNRVTVNLKQYRPFGTKTVTVDESGTASAEEQRDPGPTEPDLQNYTVKSGDCLWNIAKAKLGDGSRWREIYDLNTDKIENPNLIYPDQVLVMPEK